MFLWLLANHLCILIITHSCFKRNKYFLFSLSAYQIITNELNKSEEKETSVTCIKSKYGINFSKEIHFTAVQSSIGLRSSLLRYNVYLGVSWVDMEETNIYLVKCVPVQVNNATARVQTKKPVATGITNGKSNQRFFSTCIYIFTIYINICLLSCCLSLVVRTQFVSSRLFFCSCLPTQILIWFDVF